MYLREFRVKSDAMCRLWYVLSGCSKLTALRLLGDYDWAETLAPQAWDPAPHGLTTVRLEESHGALDFSFLLDGLRELELCGESLAAFLNHKKKRPEVGSFLAQTSSCTACDIATLAELFLRDSLDKHNKYRTDLIYFAELAKRLRVCCSSSAL